MLFKRAVNKFKAVNSVSTYFDKKGDNDDVILFETVSLMQDKAMNLYELGQCLSV